MGKRENFKIAQKKFGDEILAIFCYWNGGLGLARFRRRRRRPSSCPAKPESSESPKKAKSRKKMKRPTTAGAACRRAQRPATPAHAQAPRRQLPNEGVAKMVSSLARK